MSKKNFAFAVAVLIVFCAQPLIAQELTPEEQLGKLIFFDQSLSIPGGGSPRFYG